MSTLSTWRFATADGAEAALRTVERLQYQRRVTVDDAAVVAWPSGVLRPRSYQAGTATGAAALSGAFWGLLFGLLFLLPLAGPDVASDQLKGLARVGLPDAFLRRLRERITPGTSALFLFSENGELDRIGEALAGRHPDLVVSDLDRDQEAALHRAFDADDDLTTQ